jgi:hypothetical protein
MRSWNQNGRTSDGLREDGWHVILHEVSRGLPCLLETKTKWLPISCNLKNIILVHDWRCQESCSGTSACQVTFTNSFCETKNHQIPVWTTLNANQLFRQGFGTRTVHKLTGILDRAIHGNHTDSSYMCNSQVWFFCSPYGLNERSCKMKKTSGMIHFDRWNRLNTAFGSSIKSWGELFYPIISKRQRMHSTMYSGAHPHSLVDGSVIGNMISDIV